MLFVPRVMGRGGGGGGGGMEGGMSGDGGSGVEKVGYWGVGGWYCKRGWVLFVI